MEGLLADWFGAPAAVTLWTLVKIIAIVIPVTLGVAYLTLAERKVIGYMQLRLGPNRVGPKGLFQPFADVLKLLVKEVIVPSGANKFLFIIAPTLSLMPALAAWAVMPFTGSLVLSNIDAGLLYIMAITSMGVYGVIVAGWVRELTSPEESISFEVAAGSVARTYPVARRLAYLFWGTTIAIAFLGVAKPF